MLPLLSFPAVTGLQSSSHQKSVAGLQQIQGQALACQRSLHCTVLMCNPSWWCSGCSITYLEMLHIAAAMPQCFHKEEQWLQNLKWFTALRLLCVLHCEVEHFCSTGITEISCLSHFMYISLPACMENESLLCHSVIEGLSCWTPSDSLTQNPPGVRSLFW